MPTLALQLADAPRDVLVSLVEQGPAEPLELMQRRCAPNERALNVTTGLERALSLLAQLGLVGGPSTANAFHATDEGRRMVADAIAASSEDRPPTDPPESSDIIWKVILNPSHDRVSMPKGARLVHVHEQGDNVCVWAEANPNAPIVERILLAVGTGHALPPGAYVGTAHLVTLGRVFHVYDGGEVHDAG